MKRNNKFIYGLISLLLLTQITVTHLYCMENQSAEESKDGSPLLSERTGASSERESINGDVFPGDHGYSTLEERLSLKFPIDSRPFFTDAATALTDSEEKPLSIKAPAEIKRTTSDSNSNKSFDGCPYSPHAHHQTTVNDQAMITLVNTLHTHFGSHSIITILDLCCGHGAPSHKLFDELRKVNVTAYITGWDIAPLQIDEANAKYKPLAPDHLTFDVQDVEKMHERTDIAPFDVVISLFGLHWMDNITATAASIHAFTKPTGLMMSLVPLGDSALFAYRQNFMRTARWNHYFVDYILHNFQQDHQIYHNAFILCFEDKEDTTEIMNQTFTYKKEQLKSFVASWIPELRHIKECLISQGLSDIEISALQNEYLNRLTDYIFSNLYKEKMEGSTKSTDTLFSIDQETIQFNGRFYAFYGMPHQIDF